MITILKNKTMKLILSMLGPGHASTDTSNGHKDANNGHETYPRIVQRIRNTSPGIALPLHGIVQLVLLLLAILVSLATHAETSGYPLPQPNMQSPYTKDYSAPSPITKYYSAIACNTKDYTAATVDTGHTTEDSSAVINKTEDSSAESSETKDYSFEFLISVITLWGVVLSLAMYRVSDQLSDIKGLIREGNRSGLVLLLFLVVV